MTYESTPRPELVEEQGDSSANPANAATNPDPSGPSPDGYRSDGHDTLRLIAIGPPQAVENCRFQLHHLGYAEANDWSHPMPGVTTDSLRIVNPSHVMRILTKRIPRPRKMD